MDMLHARPMLVADHFMTSHEQTAAPAADMGEVCETCHAHCAGKTELWRHARDVHGADHDLSCPEPGCGRRFFAAAMCAGHRAHHRRSATAGQRDADDDDDSGPLTCELCGRFSKNRFTFDKHVNAEHPEARAAMCGVCHSYKGEVLSLVAHVRRRHAVDARPRHGIRCTVCGKRYGNNRNMYLHRRVHGLPDDVIIAPAQTS